MNRKLFWTGILAILALAGFLIFFPRHSAPVHEEKFQGQATGSSKARIKAQPSLPPGTKLNLWTNTDGAVYHRDGTNLWWVGGNLPKEYLPTMNLPSPEDVRKNLEAEKTKRPALVAAYDDINREQIIFYGRAVDENTNGLVGATVKGEFITMTLQGEQSHTYAQPVGNDGYFTITGEGSSLTVGATKDPDYHYAPIQLFRYSQMYGAIVHKPNPNNPVIFKLTQIKLSEELIYFSRGFRAPHTGEPVRIDLTTGQIVSQGGDLIVSIYHPDPYSNLVKPPWSMTITAVNGGFIRTDDSILNYMFEAPPSEYVPVIEANMASDDPEYRRQFEGCYYVMTHNGQHYAKISFGMDTFWDERGVPFSIKSYLNPNASRILEVDNAKVTNLNTLNNWR